MTAPSQKLVNQPTVRQGTQFDTLEPNKHIIEMQVFQGFAVTYQDPKTGRKTTYPGGTCYMFGDDALAGGTVFVHLDPTERLENQAGCITAVILLKVVNEEDSSDNAGEVLVFFDSNHSSHKTTLEMIR